MPRVYKVLRGDEWRAFEAAGSFAGSPDDVRDGFIHLSSAEQLAGTIAKHFAGETGLWRIELDAHALGDALRWEASRGGAAFPHLYRAMAMGDVVAAVSV